MRVIILLLIAINLFGQSTSQEIYPGQIPCFCVPNVDVAYAGGGTKAWKIEVIDVTMQTCNPNTFQQMVLPVPIYLRDSTVSAWASTDYYNQLANDSVSTFLRNTAYVIFPNNGNSPDDFGFVFNARLKDPPTTGGPCNPLFGTPSGIHGMRIMLALETLNGNYRHGSAPSTKRIGGVFLKLKIYTGSTVNTVTLQHTNPSCTDFGPPTCTDNCALRYGSNPTSNNMTGYFTDASLSKIWRNNRNIFKMVNIGLWPGYKPYTKYLVDSRRRCQTFGSYSCSDLTLADNNAIADLIINSKTNGDCMPVCAACDAYEEPYWNYQPYSPCPTPQNGTITFVNPNSTFTSGTWQIYRNGSLWGSGSLPATNIPVNAGYGSGNNGTEWRVDMTPTGCPTISRKMVAYDQVCGAGCTQYIGNVTTQPVKASCFNTTSGSILNKLPVSSGMDSVRAYTTPASGYTLYKEYQKYIATNIPNPASSTQLVNVWFKKGADCTLIHQYSFMNRVCPCETNRYIEFNSNGIDAGKKTTLQSMGWTVTP